MLMVEVSLGCMVTVVSKLIVLDQKGQIPKLTLKQFGRVTGIAENKQKSIFIQKTMGLNMYMGIFIIKLFADKFYLISLCNSHYSWHQTGGQSSRLSSTKPLLSCTEDRTMETFARNNLDVQTDKKKLNSFYKFCFYNCTTKFLTNSIVYIGSFFRVADDGYVHNCKSLFSKDTYMQKKRRSKLV